MAGAEIEPVSSAQDDVGVCEPRAADNAAELPGLKFRAPDAVLLKRQAARSHLVCVIPMYNEGGHARRFLRELHAHVAPAFGQITIVVVDDGSSDTTSDEVCAAREDGVPVHFIRLSRNFGKEVALTSGLAATERLQAPADVVLIMDSDFQHPFDTIRPMTRKWEQGTDMVYGIQRRHRTSGPFRRALTWAFYRVLGASNDRFTIPLDAGDFRLMDRKVVTAINRLPERNRYMKGLYAWVGFVSEGVPFESLPRADGHSSFGLKRLTELALDGLTAFSSWPLRVASICGLVISLIAFLYTCWILFERIWIGQPIPGFATLAAAVMFFSGAQLMSIGLLGEYVGRVFLEVKGRPLYIISEEIEAPAGNRLTDPPSARSPRS